MHLDIAVLVDRDPDAYQRRLDDVGALLAE
jgi:hypothetical protein